MVPLDDELAAPHDREAVLAVCYALVQPDFGFVQTVGIEAGLIRGTVSQLSFGNVMEVNGLLLGRWMEY